MKLDVLIDKYLDHQRSLGMRCSEKYTLRFFGRTMGNIAVNRVRPEKVRRFIMGDGPLTGSCYSKFSIVGSLYRYAMARGYATASPVPPVRPKPPSPIPPYIYSLDEIKRLLMATERIRRPNSRLQSTSMYTFLLLLYGTGMRVREALSLTMNDVDLARQLLTVRDTKFFKSRLVPIGPRLAVVLGSYELRRRQLPMPDGEASAFFVSRSGHHWQYQSAKLNFVRLRLFAGVRRPGGARCQPRMHDFRHTMAVHRLVTWYRAGLDVQRLLPHLSTYLGHVHIRSTQRYLSMTPELLHEANLRFERYANPEEPP